MAREFHSLRALRALGTVCASFFFLSFLCVGLIFMDCYLIGFWTLNIEHRNIETFEDFNPLWLAEFKRTNAHEVWERVTDEMLFDIVEPR